MKKTILAAAAMALACTHVSAEVTFLNFGTGGQSGVYYVVGQSVCKLVNRNTAETGVKCSPSTSAGSIANLRSIDAGESQLGMAQSDWQYHAYNGSSEFADAKNDKLRVVFSVYPELFSVIVRNDAGIKHFDDLAGKRVNVAEPGSGTRATADLLMAEKGWTTNDFSLASELKGAEVADALCDNNIDAFFYNAGHPIATVESAVASCQPQIVPVTGEYVDSLLEKHPYYAKASVPGGLYRGMPDDVPTFAVYATLVSSTDVADEAIYQTVKAVFENFDRFKKLHPAFANLTPQDMLEKGVTIPFHPGAERYYREKGWIK